MSNKPDLVSLEFVMAAYNSDAMYWTKTMDSDTTGLMIEKSSIMGLYRHNKADKQVALAEKTAGELEQVGMARFITDHVTHAYLTDVYVVPQLRRNGLGTWLVQCCSEFIEKMPFLRKAMLSTSNPKRNALFYQNQLGMSIPLQDPESNLVLMRKGQKPENIA